MSKKELRGGNSGSMTAGGDIQGGSQACLRKVLLRSYSIEEEMNASSRIIFPMGAAVEEIVQKEIEREEPGIVLKADVEGEEKITDNIRFFFHEDLVEYREDKPYRCIELKSVWSSNAAKKIFGEKKYKEPNLIQLIQYMTSFETAIGTLRYTSMIYHSFTYKGEKIKVKTGDVQEFQVELKEDGFFYVDSVKTEFNVESLLRFREAAADILDNNKVHDRRPIDCDNWNPCNFCPFKSVCDIQETFSDTEEFLKLCREAVDKKPKKHKKLF